MKNFLLAFALLITLACGTQDKVPRPSMDPADKTDTIFVDSSQASLFTHASYGGRVAQVASDTSVYKVHYSLPAPLPATDAVQLRLGRDSAVGYKNQPVLTASRTAQRDSATFRVAKVYGASTKWYSCRRILRAGAQVAPERCQTWRTNLPGRQPDSLWIDSSLAVKALISIDVPTTQLTFGQQMRKCVFVLALDNKARLLKQQLAVPECKKAYDALPVTMRLAGYPVAYKTR